jgi:threonine/homoserine/homoserine lactone efflux protein
MTLFALFAMAFVTGLTGAMAPGPFLTVTISEAARRGGHVGPQLVLGHGILELVLLFLILLGLDRLLSYPTLIAIVSFAGGVVLIWMGISTARGLKRYVVAPSADAPNPRGLHPVFSGIILSLSNPYWYIWWITVAMGYLVIAKALGVYGVTAFFSGHILSDLVWYGFVSYGTSVGRRFFGGRVIRSVLLVCSLFLILFGFYFLSNGFRYLR